MTKCAVSRVLAIGLAFVAATASANEPATTNDPSCQDAKVLSGKLITDICWTCMFPIRIAGASFGGDAAKVPSMASNKSICLCYDGLGVPHPGFVVSMWEPARLVEVTKSPGCALTLGGLKLPLTDWRSQGTAGSGDLDDGDMAFRHYHYYAFPLLAMLNLYIQPNCNRDNYQDLDLMYMSEVDPTWNNDEIAFFINPEAAAIANPIALAACTADAAAATAGAPIDSLWWCAGTWGNLYPLSGNEVNKGSMPRDTSLLATRAVAALHRRGLAWNVMGNNNLCGGQIDPMLPKSMYRLSMFFPAAEAGDTITFTRQNADGTTRDDPVKTAGSHVIGESTFTWGEWRVIPGVGEDAIYVLWRWHDCCSTF
jgi:conjugal transfer pilus assembly protein TraU